MWVQLWVLTTVSGGMWLELLVLSAVRGAFVETDKLSTQASGCANSETSCAVAGDTVVTGTVCDGVGSVDIYGKTKGGGFARIQKLSSDTGYFGATVAVSGSVLVVGAPQIDWGAVFVFRSSDFTRSQRLTASDQQMYDGFGSHIAIESNVIVVSAPSQAGNSGAVYVFRRTDSTFHETQ